MLIITDVVSESNDYKLLSYKVYTLEKKTGKRMNRSRHKDISEMLEHSETVFYKGIFTN